MTALPIEPLLPELLQALETWGTAVLQAEPGAGKTTRVPLALQAAPFARGRRIIVLEPRRLAAKAAARQMARQLGERVGETVGYRVRLDSKVSDRTRVELVTDGLFLRQLQADPELADVACVVFDECHERGLESDLALALCLETRALLNPDLRLLAMSATLDAEPFARLLGDAPLISSPGRSWPVETRYREQPLRDRLEVEVVRSIRQALAEEDGSLLVFLPGQGEIRRVQELLEAAELDNDVEVVALYGDLDPRQQDAAIAPAPAGQRKVVLATSIAESSLTIEGIRVVIDSGLARSSRFDPGSGMTRLVTEKASQASADQRRGRAGRLGPGVCYRLWTAAEQQLRPAQPAPDIRTCDPTPLALTLADWGAGSGEGLNWLEPPPAQAIAQARDLLESLGALDRYGRITAHGRVLAQLGVHPRLGHMIAIASQRGLGQLACETAALLSDRDPLPRSDADLGERLRRLRRGDRQLPAGTVARWRQLTDQLRRQSDCRDRGDELDRLGEVMALAYPDRIALVRPGQPGRYQLSNGRGASLPPEDPLSREDCLAIAHLDGNARESRIFLAAPLDRDCLETLFADRIEATDQLSWDDRSEQVIALRQRRLMGLTLAEQPLDNPDPEAVAIALAEGIRRLGPSCLPWSEPWRQLQGRLQLLHRLDPESWPAVDDETLMADPLIWLGDQLYGLRRRAQLESLDLGEALLGRLDWNRRSDLDRLAPTHLPVPSGRRIAIDYSGSEPVLAVKLQEMFGAAATPTVADGRQPLLLHLLSPAGRPVQVTRDLVSFWNQGYAAVRAELRGRYPKHPWPENPWEAPAQAGVKHPRRR